MDTDYSVAIASYNGEKYIEKQIKSILNQTIPPREIIIVDDCSSDGTINIINELSKKSNIHFRIILHEVNMGYRRSFFDAIYNTTCNIIFLSDQDDIWKSNKAE